jgi:hypothetical protein
VLGFGLLEVTDYQGEEEGVSIRFESAKVSRLEQWAKVDEVRDSRCRISKGSTRMVSKLFSL